PNSRDLAKVSKSTISAINSARYGVHLFRSTGRTIEALVEQATKDRLRFGKHWLNVARLSLKLSPPQYRLSIGRAYYSMYHCARALAFFYHAGDDHEAHSELPRHLPKNFTDRANWENALKDARLLRNEADYEPYPVADSDFEVRAKDLVTRAAKFHA